MQGRSIAAAAARGRASQLCRPRGQAGASAPALALAVLARAEPVSRAFATYAGGFPFGGFPGGGMPQGDSEKFYNLLGIQKSASDKEIKQAYKKLAMQHHPDRGGDENKFKEISRAYEVLSDPEKRQIYDSYGERGLDGMGSGAGPQPGADPFDLFSQIFGFNAGGARARGRPVTQDVNYDIELSLEELYTGTHRKILYHRDALCGTCNGQGGTERVVCKRCNGTGYQVKVQQVGAFLHQTQVACAACSSKGYVIPPEKVCKTCNGRGTVKEKKSFHVEVEPGCEDGTEYRFRGAADELPDHDTGDVVVRIKEKQHKVFKRVRENLVMTKRITLSEALCGFELSTTFLDGSELVVRSRPDQVVKPGDMMKIDGKGLPNRQGGRPGDLYLKIEVDFPEELPRESQERISDILGGQPLPEEPRRGASIARRLTTRQAQDVRQRWDQAKQARDQERGGVSCEQQ